MFQVNRVAKKFVPSVNVERVFTPSNEYDLLGALLDDGDGHLFVREGWLVFFDMSGIEPDWDRDGVSSYFACQEGMFIPLAYSEAHVVYVG